MPRPNFSCDPVAVASYAIPNLLRNSSQKPSDVCGVSVKTGSFRNLFEDGPEHSQKTPRALVRFSAFIYNRGGASAFPVKPHNKSTRALPELHT